MSFSNSVTGFHGDFTLEEVLEMVDNSNTFAFKLYKKNLTLARHIGVIVYLDGRPRFTVDFGAVESGTSADSSMAAICLITEVESKVQFYKPSYSWTIKLSGDYILDIDIGSQDNKETVKKIILEWYASEHGNYDLLVNNCRHFSKVCMDIAEKYRPLRETGKNQALSMLVTTLFADTVYGVPLAPFHFARRLGALVGKMANS